MSNEVRLMGVACNLKCTYCLVKGTPVLMADGTWKAIEQVQIGEEVIGFDENRLGSGKNRRYRKATITATSVRKVDGHLIHTTKGDVSCSGDHVWLDKIGRWRDARDFKVGQAIKFVSTPVEEPVADQDYMVGYITGVSEGDAWIGHWKSEGYEKQGYRLALKDSEILDRTQSYFKRFGIELYRKFVDVGIQMDALLINKKNAVDAIESLMQEEKNSLSYLKGYLAGIFDAEGSWSNVVRITNKDEKILSKVESYLSILGFSHARDAVRRNGVTSVRLLGGTSENVKFFSTVDPSCKRKFTLEGLSMHEGWGEILSIEPIEEQDMYDLTTTASTFVAAGFASHNCYQNSIRDAGNVNTRYDLNKVFGVLDTLTSPFHLFGGEALLVPKEDLEAVWGYGLKRFNENGLQTNGALIDDDHIELFNKYKVGVGISIDGPGELNDMRWAGSLEKTRETTDKIIQNIARLVEHGVQVGIIITLHKLNGSKETLPKLKEFIRWLGDIGIKGGNIHTLEVDSKVVEQLYCLTEEESFDAFMDLANFMDENKDLKWLPFSEMPMMLQGNDQTTTCWWKRCDPMNTQAVYGIEGDGGLSNCSRGSKEGIDWYKADQSGYERYISFYHTPHEMGGCKGCRFWSMCGGSCPGEGDQGDWRNKTTHCHMMKTLLTHYEDKLEEEGVIPISKSPNLKEIEQYMLNKMSLGQNVYLGEAIHAVANRGRQVTIVPIRKTEEVLANGAS